MILLRGYENVIDIFIAFIITRNIEGKFLSLVNILFKKEHATCHVGGTKLLSPKGSHCQGILFLKAFIEDVLKIENFNYENVVVQRERNVGKLGRLDLVIENNDNLIIIEMKIDASDLESQLKRYNSYGEKSGKNHIIYYLTLFGSDADDESAGEGEDRVEYFCLSFKKDIYEWIDDCIRRERIPMLSGIREILYQYMRLIEKITNKVDRGILMEIKDILL